MAPSLRPLADDREPTDQKNIATYDMIIVGGGLVGSGLALALQHSGLRIALIDARLRALEDPRLFALNAGSCHFLANLNLWQKLQMHASPIQQVHVSNQGHFGSVRLNAADIKLANLGHVIPAQHIEAAMFAALQEQQAIDLYQPATLSALSYQAQDVHLELSIGSVKQYLSAPIVIGADGTASTVRKLANIPCEEFDYDQSAIVTRTTLHRAHQHVAYERFNAHGAIAMLPLPNNECATIWSADNAYINELMSLSDNAFLAALQKEFGYRLGRLKAIGPRHQFPLRMIQAKEAVAKGVFLLGNSAHTLHPIAAQGFNLALFEVATLAQKISAKLALNEAITPEDLQAISEQTQAQQTMSTGVSHRLAQLFLKKSLLSSVVLQLGMVGLEIATPIKQAFIAQIMGRNGFVPRLLLSPTTYEETV